jgi:hypothetical protein
LITRGRFTLPDALRLACILMGVVLVAQTAIAPWAEGLFFILTWIVVVLLIALFWAFSRRRAGTIDVLRAYAAMGAIAFPAFALAVDGETSIDRVSQALLVVEAFACAWMYVLLRRRTTLDWFYARAGT